MGWYFSSSTGSGRSAQSSVTCLYSEILRKYRDFRLFRPSCRGHGSRSQPKLRICAGQVAEVEAIPAAGPFVTAATISLARYLRWMVGLEANSRRSRFQVLSHCERTYPLKMRVNHPLAVLTSALCSLCPRLGDVCSAQGLLAAPLHAVGDRQRPWPTTDRTAASRATSMCPHEDVDLKTCCLVLAEQRELRDPGKGRDDVHDVDGARPGRLKKRGSMHLC